MTTIKPATTPDDYASFAIVIGEYFAWLAARHQDQQWLIDRIATAQSLDAEMASLPAAYGPPEGRAFLAYSEDGELVGAGAWRRLGDSVCEMKRVFVRAPGRGQGVGRQLCAAIIASARADGYRLMRLDTGKRLTEAMTLYRSMGFVDCSPYNDYGPEITAQLVFMELPLDQAAGGT